jgi:Amt family ammonium transporter
MFYIIKRTIGLRVTPEIEASGLDMPYHGIESYPEFDSNDLPNPQNESSGMGTPIPATSGD